jgi:pilus assembly protein CpaB
MLRQRTGLILMLVGIVLAGLVAVFVINLVNQATEAGRAQLRQVAVVTTSKDIPDQTQITAEGLVVKPFPADFAPAGALGSIDQVVGKFANGFIAKDQVLVAGQITPTRRSPILSDRVPLGKVAVWLPMPEMLASANVLRPGDHVDILLSIAVGANAGGSGGGGLSTQTTLQNVEVFRLGLEEVNVAAPRQAPSAAQSGSAAMPKPGSSTQPGPSTISQPVPEGQAPPPSRAIGFLVDHQDAVIIKFVKDSGGTIDLVLRSAEEEQVIRTEAMTLDSLVERFRFRVPQSVVR